MARVTVEPLEQAHIEKTHMKEALMRERLDRAKENLDRAVDTANAAVQEKLALYRGLVKKYEIRGTMRISEDCSTIEWSDPPPDGSSAAAPSNGAALGEPVQTSPTALETSPTPTVSTSSGGKRRRR